MEEGGCEGAAYVCVGGVGSGGRLYVGATSKGLLLETKICLGHRGTHFPWR